MLDVDVPGRALAQIYATATGAACDQVCAHTAASFTGMELAAAILGLPAADTVQVFLSRLVRVDVTWALTQRGTLVVNTAGRVGITVGYGSVVEPCGRRYALTNGSVGDSRWHSGYLAPTLTYTGGQP